MVRVSSVKKGVAAPDLIPEGREGEAFLLQIHLLLLVSLFNTFSFLSSSPFQPNTISSSVQISFILTGGNFGVEILCY